ncbi:heterokaryon incompatibility protein-domain-containing protein [Nemania sp. NC0429]|nr:heterokaryon incompatibility protein-domain-containing protein [Nemania sp. NC0429]
MGKISVVSALVGAVVLSKLSSADRACSSNTSPSYTWRLSDARFDGAELNATDGKAVVAVSIIPTSTNTFFECVAEWPEAWAGWSPADGNIVWSDCIWSGAGASLDTAVAFAVDWKTRTMYLSHTFPCSDKKGSDSMATGSFTLDLECKEAADQSAHCTLKNKTTEVKTVAGSPRLAADASCEENAKVYQSWQLENWYRQYKLTPGAPVTPPSSDSGPSFTLRNLANGGVFTCTPGKKTEGGYFDGACTQATVAGAAANTSASFQFDPVLDMLVVTQRWECGAEMEWPSLYSKRQNIEYASLRSNPRAFRLIKLLPPTRSLYPPFRQRLNIEIIETNVDDADGKYDTLSYCWGTGVADRVVIISPPSSNHSHNGEYRKICISASLEAALLSLARGDNICINQSDTAEKIQQVRLMGEVYARRTAETNRYFDFLSELSSEGILSRVMGPNVAHYMNVFDAKEDRDDILDLVARYGSRFPLRGLTEMLRRAWVNRLWTVQEGCLPPIVTFRCGERSLCYDCIRGGLLFHSISTTYWEIRTRNGIYALSESFLRIVKERKAIHAVLHYNVNNDKPKIGATKAEDRIYALLEKMQINNVRGTFTQFAASVAKGNIDVLLYSQMPKSPALGHQLPSWVPDWSADPLRTPYGYADLTTPVFSAGGDRDTDGVAVHVPSGVLQVKAIPAGRPDEGSSVENIEEFMEAAAKIDPRRLESTIRLSDGVTAPSLLRDIHQHVSQLGKKLIDVEAQTQSMTMMPWYWTPASEMDAIRLCAIDPIAAAGTWIKGLFLTISDVGLVMWHITRLRLYTAMIKLRRKRAKVDLQRRDLDTVLGNHYTSSLFKNIGRKLFLTDTGYVGLAPSHAKEGDEIVVIPGAVLPKRLDLQEGSEAYCDGIMDGELVTGDKATIEFRII